MILMRFQSRQFAGTTDGKTAHARKLPCTTDPADGAILVFRGNSPQPAESFAEADPYVRNGLVKSWRVRPWTTVVGKDASTPVRPE